MATELVLPVRKYNIDGSSWARITIPKPIADFLQLQDGDLLKVTIEKLEKPQEEKEEQTVPA